MRSSALGRSTSEVEVQDITGNGIWVFLRGREFFLPYHQYPWFKRAKVEDVLKVKLVHGEHLYWPALDVDLELESLRHPAQYPLVYR